MINELEIHNFKSIKDLTLPCKRFNLFIGEPNTGKSNILEALGLVSFIGVRQYDPEVELDGFVRHRQLASLFHDQEIDWPLTVRVNQNEVELAYQDGQYCCTLLGPDREIVATLVGDQLKAVDISDHAIRLDPPVSFYRLPVVEDFVYHPGPCLLPPDGRNLPALIAKDRELRSYSELLMAPNGLPGYRLSVESGKGQINLTRKVADGREITLPYSMTSESIQRLIFFAAALESNRNTALVLENPEAGIFPEDAKILAEQIALDESDNQYFIGTQDNAFVMSLFCKAPIDTIAINIVYREAYETKIRSLKPAELQELWELDLLFNLERYLEDNE